MGNFVVLFKGLARALRDPHARMLMMLSAFLIGIATTFYHLVEGWRLIDALYFSVVTLATVGYGDFVPQTDLGKLFTIGYLLCGVGLFVSAAAAVAEALVKARRGDDDAVRAEEGGKRAGESPARDQRGEESRRGRQPD